MTETTVLETLVSGPHRETVARAAQHTPTTGPCLPLTCEQLVYSYCTVSLVYAAVASRIDRILKSYVLHACKCICCKIEPSHGELLREDRGQCVRGV